MRSALSWYRTAPKRMKSPSCKSTGGRAALIQRPIVQQVRRALGVLGGQHLQLTLLARCCKATIVFVSNVFQAGKPAWIHSADNLQINAKSCEEQCLSIDKCMWGTYFEDGARAMQCWLAEETTRQPMPCGASGSSTSGELMQCVSFHKVGDSGISRHRTTAEPVATLVKQPVIGVLPCCLLVLLVCCMFSAHRCLFVCFAPFSWARREPSLRQSFWAFNSMESVW